MEPGALPIWAQAASYVIIALGAVIAGAYKYFKTESKKEESEPGRSHHSTTIDSKLIRELIDVIRDKQDDESRDIKRYHRLSQDLKEAINELNESIIVQTDTTLNLVRFVNRGASRKRAVSEEEEDV